MSIEKALEVLRVRKAISKDNKKVASVIRHEKRGKRKSRSYEFTLYSSAGEGWSAFFLTPHRFYEAYGKERQQTIDRILETVRLKRYSISMGVEE